MGRKCSRDRDGSFQRLSFRRDERDRRKAALQWPGCQPKLLQPVHVRCLIQPMWNPSLKAAQSWAWTLPIRCGERSTPAWMESLWQESCRLRGKHWNDSEFVVMRFINKFLWIITVQRRWAFRLNHFRRRLRCQRLSLDEPIDESNCSLEENKVHRLIKQKF